MNTNPTADRDGRTGGHKGFRNVCAQSCKRILARIAKAKEAILAEARDTETAPDHLLRLSLNEAEALSWLTLYPHLIFPALATEKIQGVAVWNRRQRAMAGLTGPLSSKQRTGNAFER